MNERTEIAVYSKTESALVELRNKYEAMVWDATTTKGMSAAKEARSELRGYRVELEKTRKQEKEESLVYGRLVDAEAKRITAELSKLEDPIDALIKAEEQRKADEKANKERIERERIATIRAKIDNISRWPLRCIGMSSEKLNEQVISLSETLITDDIYMELKDEALKVWSESDLQLRSMLTAKLDEEAKAQEQRLEAIRLDERRKVEVERMRIEREAEDARIQAEREVLRIENERKHAELRVAQERIDAARIQQEKELEQIAEERRKAQEIIEAAEKVLLAKQAAEIEIAREAEEATLVAIKESQRQEDKNEEPEVQEQDNLATWPEVIYLQAGDDFDGLPIFDNDHCGAITWSEDKPTDHNVEYIRADLLRL